MVQQWRVRSNLYKVKLSSITLSTGFCLIAFIFEYALTKFLETNTESVHYLKERKYKMLNKTDA